MTRQVIALQAIGHDNDLPEKWHIRGGGNERCFSQPLPGRDVPPGPCGGAAKPRVVGADTPFVAARAPGR